jgi:hypothetical protein
MAAAPNMLAGISSKGSNGWKVGITGVLDNEGMVTRVFAASDTGSRIPDELSAPTDVKLVVGTR